MSSSGDRVIDEDQAIAIALSEAGLSRKGSDVKLKKDRGDAGPDMAEAVEMNVIESLLDSLGKMDFDKNMKPLMIEVEVSSAKPMKKEAEGEEDEEEAEETDNPGESLEELLDKKNRRKGY